MSSPEDGRVMLGAVMWSLVPLAGALLAAACALLAHAGPPPANEPSTIEARP
jgi:hypothetical protein